MNFVLIEDNNLKYIIKEAFNNKYISIDTESNGLYSYENKLCLLQIEIGEKVFIIDTLKVDLFPLKEVFESNFIEKIFHSAYSDISMIRKKLDCSFNNIFDVMIASKYIFKKAVSLATLVRQYFGVNLEKKYQKINWGKRPFNHNQLLYAAMDVYYLKKLRDILIKDIININLYNEFKSNCEKISNVSERKTVFNIDKYYQMAVNFCLSEKETAIFIKAVEMREEIAKKIDIPPFKVITNELLVYVAKHHNELMDATDLKLYNRSIVRNIEWIRKAIKDVIDGKFVYRKTKNNLNNHDNFFELKLKLLKKWRREIAIKKNIQCELVIDISTLKQIAKLEDLKLEKLREIGVDEKLIAEYGNILLGYFDEYLKN
ncbi:MAG: ribonuclease D [Elusimicrobiota bacterium]